jgi:phage shock protein A
MSNYRKLITLFRGQVRQTSDAVINANALALLDQQLFETEQSLIAARRDLTHVMAERRMQVLQREQTEGSIEKYTVCARQALARDEVELLEETAQRIAALEERAASADRLIADLAAREADFKAFIRDSGEHLRALRQQQALARVNDTLQRSDNARHQHGAGLTQKLADSRETLAEIETRQQRAQLAWQARCQMDAEMSGDDLDQRLQQAGMMESRNSRTAAVIERLRKGEHTA